MGAGKYQQITCNIGHVIKALGLFGVSHIAFNNKTSFVKLAPSRLYTGDTIILKGPILFEADHHIRIFSICMFRDVMS